MASSDMETKVGTTCPSLAAASDPGKRQKGKHTKKRIEKRQLAHRISSNFWRAFFPQLEQQLPPKNGLLKIQPENPG